MLKWFGIAVAFLVIGYFIGAIFSYPGGPREGITNLGQAAQFLNAKITSNDEKAAEIEEVIQQEEENWQPPEDPQYWEELWNKEKDSYPYIAKLPPELEGKIIVLYNYSISDNGQGFSVTTIFKNLSDETLMTYHQTELFKDDSGNSYTSEMSYGGGSINMKKGQCGSLSHSRDDLPSDLKGVLKEIKSIEVVVIDVSFS